MRKTMLLSGLGVALGLLSTAAAAQGYGYGDRGAVVRCESPDGRFRQCTADTRGGVDLVRQFSGAPCIRGRTWGDDARGIWVNDGCRGEFRIGVGGGHGGNYGGGQVFRCESERGRGRQCAVDARGDVRLLRQLSSLPCVEGRTWGRDRSGVWVDRGCRGEFQIVSGRGRWRGNDGYGYDRGGPGYGNGYRQTLRCESDNGRNRYCNAEVFRGARLQRQLSASACVEGRTWGWDRGGVWVDRGCRGEFAVW